MTQPQPKLRRRAGPFGLAGLMLALMLAPAAAAPAGEASDGCEGFALPVWPPPGGLPAAPAPPQPYEAREPRQGEASDGDIRALDGDLFSPDWYRQARLPLFERPGRAAWGWIAEGWLIDLSGPAPQATPFTSRGLEDLAFRSAPENEVALRAAVFRVLLETHDGWLLYRWGEEGQRDGGLAWIHVCHLGQLDPPLRFARPHRFIVEPP